MLGGIKPTPSKGRKKAVKTFSSFDLRTREFVLSRNGSNQLLMFYLTVQKAMWFKLMPRRLPLGKDKLCDIILQNQLQKRIFTKMIIPVKWTDEGVEMLDQRLLPTEEKWLMLKTYNDVADGIRDMVIRGAPAIGVSCAYGIALGLKNFVGTNIDDMEEELDYICDVLGKDASDRNQPVLGDQQDEESVCRRQS